MNLEDKGYQETVRDYANSLIPYKKPKDGELSESEHNYNRALSSERICIKDVNRRLKVFKILAPRDRNRRKRYGLRFHLIAALYNHERAIAAWQSE